MNKRLHRISIIFFLVMPGVVATLKAQVPNPVSFNTAVNAGLNGTIPLLANDLSWTASTVSINGPYVPAVRASNLQMAWLVSPYSTANWITYPHTCSSDPTYHSCVGPVEEYYRLIFTLPATVCDKAVNISGGYCLTMNYFADNCVREIFVNGVSSFNDPGCHGSSTGFSATGGKTVTICDNWQPGTNTLVARVTSGLPTVGFLAFITATASTPGGFTVATTHSNVSCFASTNGAATVNLSGYSGPASYTWLPAGGNASTATNLSSGIYTVNVQLPLCDLTSTLHVTEPASFAVTVSTVQPSCNGSKVTYTASGGSSYVWAPGNLSGPVVTLTPNGITIYTVTATDSIGCKTLKSFKPQVVNCTGIDESAFQDVQVLNNTSGNLVIVAGVARECRVEIFDLNGKIKFSKITTLPFEIDVNDLPAGIYILGLSDNNASARRRIIVGR